MKSEDIQKLSESMTIFANMLGHLEYALKLYDEYKDQILPEYYSGTFPHPYNMIAEDYILLLLNNFIEESKKFNKLMQENVPPKCMAFKRLLKNEGWLIIIRNRFIAHARRDKKGRFVSLGEIYKTYSPNPEAVRELGEKLKDILKEIATYYMRESWFPELRKLVEKESFDPHSGKITLKGN